MTSVVDNIRAKIKRRFSHKEENPNYDDYDEADEETSASVNKEYEKAELNDEEPYGKPGSVLNRLIMHGNKKTEDQLARERAEYEAKPRTQGTTAAGATTSTTKSDDLIYDEK